MNLREHIRTIPDFPIPGIRFRDITPLLGDPDALAESIEAIHAAGGSSAQNRGGRGPFYVGGFIDLPIVDTVRNTFPAHEHDQFIAHFRGLLGAWAHDQRATAA